MTRLYQEDVSAYAHVKNLGRPFTYVDIIETGLYQNQALRTSAARRTVQRLSVKGFVRRTNPGGQPAYFEVMRDA